jgi:hypothetical protein
MDVKKRLLEHLIDTTATCAVAVPLFTAIDAAVGTVTGTFSEKTSLDARAVGVSYAYLGIGYAYAALMRTSRKAFDITDTHPNVGWHDIAYAMAFNMVYVPATYIIAGERDGKNIAATTAAIMLSCIPFGYVSGRAMSGLRDLVGYESSTWLPKKITQERTSRKLALAVGSIAFSVGLTAGIYWGMRKIQ